MKIEIKGWIWAKATMFGNKVEFEFSSNDYEKWAKTQPSSVMDWGSHKKIAEHTIVVDVPDDIDPVSLRVAGLERERETLRSEFARRLNEINDQISRLTAIEYTPATVVEPA